MAVALGMPDSMLFVQEPPSGLLFPDAVLGKQMDTREYLQGAGEPVFGGLHPANEMRGLLVLFEGIGAGIDFVEVQAVLVRTVLNHIEQETRALVPHGPACVVEHGLHEFLPVFRLDVNIDHYSEHVILLDVDELPCAQQGSGPNALNYRKSAGEHKQG